MAPDTHSAIPGDVESLVQGVLAGNRRAVARTITRVENGGPEAGAILSQLYRHTGRAHVVGVTGAPGTGKSTLVGAMASQYRMCDLKVGIIAVDPTSPFSGGAILGDRIRMRDLTGDPGVFIRSMATRGHLGGLATATSDVIRVLDAAQCQVIIVETVGVGQAEVDVARMAHTVLVVEAPGLGDDIQTLKAGLMEISDIFVVNKSDLPGADLVVTNLRMSVELSHASSTYGGHHAPGLTESPRQTESGSIQEWHPPVVEVTALHREGIGDLLDAVESHREFLQSTGFWYQRERARIEADLEEHVKTVMMRRLRGALPDGRWTEVVEDIVSRRTDPHTASQALVDSAQQ